MKRIGILGLVLLTSLGSVGWAQTLSPSFMSSGTSDADAQDTRLAIASCSVITRPGSYVLARGITATQRDLKSITGSAPSCILIVADFVSLDLHGYTIAGPGSGFGIYSTRNASGKYPIATHVRNGSVTGFDRGIAVEGAGHTVKQVRVTGNAAGLTIDGGGMMVEEVVAIANGEALTCFSGPANIVRNSVFQSNGGNGINLLACPGSSIVGNTVSGSGGGGILAQCPSVILQNMAFQNGGGDILADPAACTRSNNNPVP